MVVILVVTEVDFTAITITKQGLAISVSISKGCGKRVAIGVAASHRFAETAVISCFALHLPHLALAAVARVVSVVAVLAVTSGHVAHGRLLALGMFA